MPFAPIFPTPFLTWLFFLGAIFALLAVSEPLATVGLWLQPQLVSGVDWLAV